MKKVFIYLFLSIISISPYLCLFACNSKLSSADTNKDYSVMVEIEDKRGFELFVEKVGEESELLIITDGLDNYAYIETKKENFSSENDFISFKMFVSIFSDQIEIYVNNNEIKDYNLITTEDGFYNYYIFKHQFTNDLTIKIKGNFEILYL